MHRIPVLIAVPGAGTAAQPDTLELDLLAFPGWSIVLRQSGWVLGNGRDHVRLGSLGNPRARIVRGGSACLLVGADGYASIQGAMDDAQAGDTVLVAPGTYLEGRSFTAEELGGSGMPAGVYGLVVNKSLALQGVADDGARIVDRDDVAATVIAGVQPSHETSFAVVADGVTIRGLGFAPASATCAGAAGIGKVFDVRGERFRLAASVIERRAPWRTLSAIHFGSAAGQCPPESAFICGNLLHGSITVQSRSRAPGCTSARIVINDNDVIGDLLPAVMVSGGTEPVAGAEVELALPVLEDNMLRTMGEPGLTFGAGAGDPGRHLDSDGRDQGTISRPAGTASPVRTRTVDPLAPADGERVFNAIQPAIEAAASGDTILIAAGTYREALVIDGKALTMRGAEEGVVAITPPGSAEAGLEIRGGFASGDAGDGLLDIQGLSFSTGTVGIAVQDGAVLGELVLSRLQFADLHDHAVRIGSGNAGDGPATAIGKITVRDCDFANNGARQPHREGTALKLWRYAGGLEVQRCTFVGAAAGYDAPSNAIEMHGPDSAEPGGRWPLGHVLLSGVLVAGHFTKHALAIRNYAEVSGLAIVSDGDHPGMDLTAAVMDAGPPLGVDAMAAGNETSTYSLLFPGQMAAISGASGHSLPSLEGSAAVLRRIRERAAPGDEPGFDQAVFTGNRADYRITLAGTTVLVSSLTEGTHALTHIDVLSFLDGIIDLAAPVRLFDADGHLKGAHASIQEAIDMAAHGDRLSIAPGHYPEDLHVLKTITLTGANAGLPGDSPRRSTETAVCGHVVIGCDTTHVVIDGLAIVGDLKTEPSAAADQHLALRNCVIDGRRGDAAISVLSGSGTTIANNLIIGGTDEAIYVPYGFEDLAITGNRIQTAEGATGIALNGGAGVDSVHICGNTLLGGDYGVLIEVDSGLAQRGDTITIAGNTFGEAIAGMPTGGPTVAAVHADSLVPAQLASSLGASLDLNTYHVSGAAVGVDVMFGEASEDAPAASVPKKRTERARGGASLPVVDVERPRAQLDAAL